MHGFIQDIKAKKEHYYKTKLYKKAEKEYDHDVSTAFWGLIVIFIMAILIGYSFQGFHNSYSSKGISQKVM